MNRRQSLAAALSLGPAAALRAQEPSRVYRIGMLTLAGYDWSLPGPIRFRDALAAHGFVIGNNLTFDVRHVDQDASRLDAQALALVRSRPDLLMGISVPASHALKRATTEIPIVAFATHGAVETGLVSNLRRPGGNITGTETLAPEMDAKRLQMFRQLVPSLRRLAVVTDDIDKSIPVHLDYIRRATSKLGAAPIVTWQHGAPGEFGAALAAAASDPPDGVLLVTTAKTWEIARTLFDTALQRRLPTFCEFRTLALWGCLISYGPSFFDIHERTAAQIARILKGTPPGELPVELPTRFELIVNLKTARAIGVTVPQELLLRADEVIE